MNIHASRARAVCGCFLQNATGNPKKIGTRKTERVSFPSFFSFRRRLAILALNRISELHEVITCISR